MLIVSDKKNQFFGYPWQASSTENMVASQDENQGLPRTRCSARDGPFVDGDRMC